MTKKQPTLSKQPWIEELHALIAREAPAQEIIAWCKEQQGYQLSPSTLRRYRNAVVKKLSPPKQTADPSASQPSPPLPAAPPSPAGIDPAAFHQQVVLGAIEHLKEGGRVTVAEAQRSLAELQHEEERDSDLADLVKFLREEVYGL